MKTLLAAGLVVLVACADAIAGPQGTPLSGRWNVASSVSPGLHICQLVGYITITGQAGNTYSATFDGLRGCDSGGGGLPTYSLSNLTLRVTADSIFFNLDPNTRFYGQRLPGDRTWDGHTFWHLADGRSGEGVWSAANCRILTNCECSAAQLADGTCGR